MGPRSVIFLAWTDAELDVALPGPWIELRRGAPGLYLVESDQTLSRVFHEIKWSLPDGAALLVAPLDGRPKLRGVDPGTLSWLRARLPS